MRQLALSHIVLLSTFWFASAQTLVPGSPPTLATNKDKGTQTVAIVAGQHITRADLQPGAKLQQKIKAAPSGQQANMLLMAQRNILMGTIWRTFHQRFAQEHQDVLPHPNEIDSYLKYSRESALQMLGKLKMELLDNQTKLSKNQSHSSKARKALLSEKHQLEKNFKLQQELLANEDDPELMSSHRHIAWQVVAIWKYCKALYSRYGGEVVSISNNPLEPIGAYRKYYLELQHKGQLSILDPELSRVFWQYFLESPHPSLAPESIDYSKPWWEEKSKEPQTKP
jgi:hypothetical protein